MLPLPTPYAAFWPSAYEDGTVELEKDLVVSRYEARLGGNGGSGKFSCGGEGRFGIAGTTDKRYLQFVLQAVRQPLYHITG